MISEEAVGIWLDFRRALIIRVNEPESTAMEIFSGAPRRPHATGGLKSRWPWWSRTSRSGGHQIQHRNFAIQQYLQRIADRLQAGEFVLIIGPGKARCVLKRYLCQRYPGWSNAIATYPVDNHLTPAQISALIKDYFGKKLPRRLRALQGEEEAGIWHSHRLLESGIYGRYQTPDQAHH